MKAKRKRKPLTARARKRDARTKKAHRDAKRDLVMRGLCRQCGKTRGKSLSSSRCTRCLERGRAMERARDGHRAYRRGGPGRPPLREGKPAAVRVENLNELMMPVLQFPIEKESE